MSERSAWIVDRTEATSRGGMVAAKTPQAAEAGAEVLRKGGNAVDAAVACAFVAGVVEPWMNGVGGGGYLVRHDAASGAATVVEFPMVAPAGATEAMFPLSGGAADAALFGWPTVVDNANIVGHGSVAVPGTVDGLALALETYGSQSLADMLEPAIAFAEEGSPVTWHTTLEIARDLANLARFPATRAIYCDASGFAPFTIDESNPVRMRQTDLGKTLRRIAAEGPRAFYEGELGETMACHLSEHGAPFSPKDFAGYHATMSPAVSSPFDGFEIHSTGGASGGTTLAESVRLLNGLDIGRFGHNSPEAIHLMTQAFRIAFADRYAYLADPICVDVPIDALLSPEYLDSRRASIDVAPFRGVRAGDRSQLGVKHNLATSMPQYTKGGCTTHLSVIDKDGVAVSLTQTLLGVWGSRVVVPGTGVLLNNGMMWFDPEPGRPNSVAGGKRALSNMTPAILSKDGSPVAAIGASGGRRIMNCIVEIVSNMIHHGMSMQPAVTAPRFDASTPDLLVDARFERTTIEQLTALGHHIVVKDELQFRGEFASPACVQFADGAFRGGVDPFYFPATAVGV